MKQTIILVVLFAFAISCKKEKIEESKNKDCSKCAWDAQIMGVPAMIQFSDFFPKLGNDWCNNQQTKDSLIQSLYDKVEEKEWFKIIREVCE